MKLQEITICEIRAKLQADIFSESSIEISREKLENLNERTAGKTLQLRTDSPEHD